MIIDLTTKFNLLSDTLTEMASSSGPNTIERFGDSTAGRTKIEKLTTHIIMTPSKLLNMTESQF